MEPSAHWCLARSLSFSPAFFAAFFPHALWTLITLLDPVPQRFFSSSFIYILKQICIGNSGEVLTGKVLELFLFPWSISGMLNRSALSQTHWLYELLMEWLLFIWKATCCIYLSFYTLCVISPLLKIVYWRLIYCVVYINSWQKAGWVLPKNFPPIWMSRKLFPSEVICQRLVCIPYIN